MSNYKLIVAGSRAWTNEELMLERMRDFAVKYIDTQHTITIVSGTARGADTMGEKIAREWGIEVLRMPANWDLHRKAAGYIRNEEMAAVADGCLICWDGRSRGSYHMYTMAQKYKLDTMLVTSLGQTI